ncbi:DUF1127 domain-containing protein [Maritimibacter sp. UBA3975]|uniref:DUF1127 domain-containing protein n=1 Tax=Maritimibacter sp. UBA3975 TaxID=1946833 RepID=UPI000C09631C|nr:DUF1127 domain-containing protein [Maritimibacter sp. UBA3975]MAM62659.1 hypothetical protein [Maritimibacter sp.]|tara:strand:+ start:1446 stop:1658 length:213 start_codon:yes stop_codon:yes gene_type:complete
MFAASRHIPRTRRGRFSALDTLGAAISARRERRALARLDDHLLEDIGLSRRDAWSESRRPFWELSSRHHR